MRGVKKDARPYSKFENVSSSRFELFEFGTHHGVGNASESKTNRC